MTDQIAILVLLAITVAAFLWGRWRHDMIAVGALLACVLAGLVPRPEAFAGFGHPAVITVASVLILSRALQVSGAVDVVVQRVLPTRAGPTATIALLSGLCALLSAFMNNVGALALLMPVAIQMASRLGLTPGRVLMPMAFASLLGGMTMLIGTPPNLIVSGFRDAAGRGPFAMFDFTPVGTAVAAGGLLFLGLVGWRLVPARPRTGAESFVTGTYLTEARILPESKANGKTLRQIGHELAEADAQVVGLIRNNVRVVAPGPERVLQAEDILVIEAEPESLATALASLGLKLVADVPVQSAAAPAAAAGATPAGTPSTEASAAAKDRNQKRAELEDVTLMELVARPDTYLIGRSATDLQLRTRFRINLLALSRKGQHSIRRLRAERIQAGDVLLVQGAPDAILSFGNTFGCVPLAPRDLRIPNRRRAFLAGTIFVAAVAGAALGLLPAAIMFAGAVLVAMATRVISPRAVYEAVDWPVIVLLAALLPVAGAMASTGAADLLARLLLDNVARGNSVVGLAVILIVTMTLSDFMNNAATAAVMCPIAISTATQLHVCPDAFLMAVAIGASCAFLTPIGHQNNTLILGPGGFRFGDYWRLGLPLEILVAAIAVPLLLRVWPL